MALVAEEGGYFGLSTRSLGQAYLEDVVPATGMYGFVQFVGSALSVYAIGQILGMLAGMTGDEANTLSYIGVAAYVGVYAFGEGGFLSSGGGVGELLGFGPFA